jgi:putative Mn2+ efflux pump MntP
MYRKFAIVLAALAAFALTAHSADARKRRIDPRIDAVSTGVGAGWTVGYFAINGGSTAAAVVGTTFGCMATSPMVATVVLHRPLSYREAHILIGSCLIPFIGGWLVNEAYNSGVFWAPDEKHTHRRRHHR